MVTKNLSSIGPSNNVKPIPIWHSIPPVSEVDFEFKIETESQTISLKDLVMKGSLTDGATNTIGSFELNIIDPDKTIYNLIDTFDKLKFYANYGEPVDLRFTGYIERKGYQDIYTVISGRSIGMIFSNKNIIYNSDGAKSRDTIIKEIIEANFSDYNINVDNIEEDETTLNVNYYEIPFTDIIEEICGQTHDFYLDHSFNAHYFEKGYRTNSTDGISQEQNHIETTDNAYDTENTYTKVRVYGQTIDNVPLISTSTTDTTNTKGVKKEYKIDDNSVTNTDQANDLANLSYDSYNQIPKVGSFSSILLPTIQPGEKLFLAIPREDIDPGYYTINSYTHEFDLESEYDKKTTVNMVKRRDQISDIIKKRIKFENKISENLNPYDLDFSLVITFSSDIGTHDGTEINEDYLKMSSGETVGTWISQVYTFNSNLSKLDLKWSGEYLVGDYQVDSSQLWYSLDGGTTWIPALLGNSTLSLTNVPTGTDFRLKVILKKSDAKVKVIGALYSY